MGTRDRRRRVKMEATIRGRVYNPARPRLAGATRGWQRPGADCPSAPPEGTSPADTLASDSGLQSWERMNRT